MLSRIITSLADSWRDGGRAERVAFVVGGLLFASGLGHVGYLLVTGGSWVGPTSLRKAATFGLSFGLTLATVAWVVRLVPLTGRSRTLPVAAFTAVSTVETALVSLQAWRGVPSHFNFETGFDTAVSMTLAAGGFVIIATFVGMTLAVFRAGRRQSPAMRLATRFGFVTLLVALALGAAMIATGSAAARGPDPSVAYETAGFLKPAHAVTMHAILVIPGLAWLLTFTQWGENRQTNIVRLSIVGYMLLALVIIIESATHTPPFSAPPLAMAVSGLGLAALTAAAGLGLYGVLRHGQHPDNAVIGSID
jgi:hypothetical protein